MAEDDHAPTDSGTPPQEQPGGRAARRHRRVSRPATGGDPKRALGDLDGQDSTSVEWAAAGGAKGPRTKQAAQDRWWQEQRPPHWE